MRKAIAVLSLILLVLGLVACKENKIIREVGPSDKFSKAEINSSLDKVIEDFDFKGSSLKKVWYDEEKSEREVGFYMRNGRGSVNGVERENVIILLSEFDVDSSGGDGSLNPNSTYENFMWILIRNDKSSPWEIDDRGY